MTDYNDGQIHGWNGGECPVHPESKVNVWLRGISGSFDKCAGQLWWGHLDTLPGGDIVCFQVTKPYAEPKTIYVNEWPNGEMLAYDTEERAKRWSSVMHCRIAVKYVEKQK